MSTFTYRTAGQRPASPAHRVPRQHADPLARELGAGDACPIMVRLDDGRLASLADVDPRAFAPLARQAAPIDQPAAPQASPRDVVVGGLPADFVLVHVPPCGLECCTASLMDGEIGDDS